jgi:hypothetical protein
MLHFASLNFVTKEKPQWLVVAHHGDHLIQTYNYHGTPKTGGGVRNMVFFVVFSPKKSTNA